MNFDKIDMEPFDNVTAAAIAAAKDDPTAMQHASHKAILQLVYLRLIGAAGSVEVREAVSGLFAVAVGLEPDDAGTMEAVASDAIAAWEKLEIEAGEAKVDADVAECEAFAKAEGAEGARKVAGKLASAEQRKRAERLAAQAAAQRRRVDLALR